MVKRTARNVIIVQSAPGMELHLCHGISKYHRFLLERFRFNLIHHLLASPRGWVLDSLRGPCICDHSSPQNTLHFVLFCPIFGKERSRFLVPLLRDLGFGQARLALLYL